MVMKQLLKLVFIPSLIILSGCGSAPPVPDATPNTEEIEKPVDTLESRLAKVDRLMAQVTSLTDEYVRRQATMTDRRRLDALEYGEEARTILIELQDKHPDNTEIDKRLKRVCNLLEFLKRN
jgi:t-SNARE complex subunit (syntaxin)